MGDVLRSTNEHQRGDRSKLVRAANAASVVFFGLVLAAFLWLAFPFFKSNVALLLLTTSVAAGTLTAAQFAFLADRIEWPASVPVWLAGTVLLINLPYYPGGRPPLFLESVVLLAVSLIAWVSLNAILARRLHQLDSQTADRAFYAALAIYLVVFLAIGFYRFHIFGQWMSNMPLMAQSFYHTMRGTFFYNSVDWIGWKSEFAIHNNPFVILILPLYALVPKAQTLMVVQVLLLSSAAIPLYRLGRERMSPVAALALAGAFLVLPTVVSQHLYPFNQRDLGIPFLVWAIYFFRKDQFWKFIGAAVLFMSTIETFSLTVAAFGFYALASKKDLKWTVSPLVLGLGWFVLSESLISPYLASMGGGSFAYPQQQFMSFYGHLGKSPSEVIKYLALNPGVVFRTLATRDRLGFLFYLLSPFGILLPFLNPLLVVGVPDFLLNFLSRDKGTISPYPHYNVALATLIVVSSVISLEKAAAWKRMQALGEDRTRLLQTIVALSIFFLSLSQFHVWLKPEEFRPPPQVGTLRSMVAAVEPGSTVLILTPPGGAIETALSDRAWEYVIVTAKLAKNPRYVIINRSARNRADTSRAYLASLDRWRLHYERDPRYRPIIKTRLYELLERH